MKPKLLKKLCLGLLLTASSVTGWGAPGLAVGSYAVAPGGNASLPVVLAGNSSGVALQFDLVFDPTQVTAAAATPSAGVTHLLATSQPASGTLRVVLYSLANAQLKDGLLLGLQLSVSPVAVEAPVAIQITNALLADVTGIAVTPLALQPGVLTISAGAGAKLGLLVRATDGQIQFQLTGPADKRYVIQGSSDLSQWQNLSTNVLVGGQVTISDGSATNAVRRFYRARYAP